jgi:plastocyanin
MLSLLPKSPLKRIATSLGVRLNRRAILFVLTLPIFMGLGAALAAAADSIVVSQLHRHFVPEELQLVRGTTVHFVNDDNVTHHVYIDSSTMQFDSGEQPIGKTVDITFDKSGTFTVLCAIHPTMHLKVTVE